MSKIVKQVDEPKAALQPPYDPHIKHLAQVAAMAVRALVLALNREAIVVPPEQTGNVQVVVFEGQPREEQNLRMTFTVSRTNYSGGVKVIVTLDDTRVSES